MSLLRRIGTTGTADGAAPATDDGFGDGSDAQTTGSLGTRTLGTTGQNGTAGLTRPSLGGQSQQTSNGSLRRPT
ncbi:MAG: hypothetical protein M3439_13825, partial [Chloroflexota bacterium]|nr:hypothetical protein [Chloroflexota bacterium]